MAMKFDLSVPRLVEKLLPLSLRSESVMALARAAFSAYQSGIESKDIGGRFAAGRSADLFRLRHNGQVCHLRSALNEAFTSRLHGVYFRVSDIGGDLEWLYASSEDPKKRTGHIFARTETSDNDKHIYAPNEVKLAPSHTFIVWVPSDLYDTQLDKIKRFVNEYRLVTRSPQYERINS